MSTYKGNTKFANGSVITDQVCNALDFAYINAIKTMVRGNIIYVRGTVLKPHEVHELQRVDGMVIGSKTCKLVNFRGAA